MSVITVTEQRARISKRGERVIVSKDGQLVREIPLGTVDQLHVIGRGVSLTTPALVMLAQHNVEVVYLSQYGRFLASVNGKFHKHGALRLKQALFVSNQKQTLPAPC